MVHIPSLDKALLALTLAVFHLPNQTVELQSIDNITSNWYFNTNMSAREGNIVVLYFRLRSIISFAL